MPNGKVSVPTVFVSAALTLVAGSQVWSISQIVELGKAEAASQVENEYRDRYQAETNARLERIENKIDANAAALAALRGAD